MKMQDNPLTRNTTALRRAQGGRFVHLSQWFKPVRVMGADGIERTEMVPQCTRPVAMADGTTKNVEHGNTYAIGRNKFKRACRAFGLNRVQVQRRAEVAGHA